MKADYIFLFYIALTCYSVGKSIYSYYKNFALLGEKKKKTLLKYYIYSYRQPNTQDIF